MSRQCPISWLAAFEEYNRDSIDAPREFTFWAGIFTIAAALERRVWIPKSYLGRWACHPHMYITLVGPPGLRKTTVARECSAELLREASLTEGTAAASTAGLFQELLAAPRNSMFLIVEEFGELISKSQAKGEDMYDFLCKIYDGNPRTGESTISREKQVLPNPPCMNLFAAVTPKWIRERMPEIAIDGGFGARTLYIYADRLVNKTLFRHREMQKEKYKILEKKLAIDLKEITSVEEEVKISEADMDWANDWYRSVPDAESVHPKMGPYFTRKHVHMLKLATILSVAESSSLIVTRKHMEMAIQILDLNEPKMLQVFQSVGGNKYTLEMSNIVRFVERHGSVRASEVRREFNSVANPKVVEELIRGCIEAGLINIRRGMTQVNGKIMEVPFLEVARND